MCDAYLSGDLTSFEAAVVRGTHLPEEPFGLGKDHLAIWDTTGKRVCYYGGIYHTLLSPAVTIRREYVSRLTVLDLPMPNPFCPLASRCKA